MTSGFERSQESVFLFRTLADDDEYLASLVGANGASLKAKNTRRDPRVSLSIVDFHDPYQEAQLRDRVVERGPDGDFTYGDPNSIKYTGKPFPFRSPEGRVALVIEIEKARYTDTPSSLLNIRRPSDASLRILGIAGA